MPIRAGVREPKRPPSQPENGPAKSITADEGSRKRPAWVTVAPKPKPAAAGICTSCGTSRNEPNMPKPTIRAVTLVVHTPRRRIIRMSTSGCGTCSS